MTEWVAVVQEEGDEPIEIPTESDGTMLLTSVTAQFPGVTGLKFRNPATQTLRGVRCVENQLFPPDPESGWGQHTYICTRPKLMGAVSRSVKDEAALKRKSENDADGMSSKNQRVDDEDEEDDEDRDDDMDGSSALVTSDLIVLGLPWKATEEEIKEYFERFGELMMVQLKTKESGQSKGFAFIRFKDLEVQNKVLLTRHMIKERWCDVKVPESQELKNARATASCKIFVARLSESITTDDLRQHFDKFGEVTDIYIPKPFRAFAFVTFHDSKVAQSLFGKDHIIKGVSVHIGSAQPKSKNEHRSGGGGGDARGGGGGGGGGNYGSRGGNYDSGYSSNYGGSGGGYHTWGGNNSPAGGSSGGYNRGPPRGYYQ